MDNEYIDGEPSLGGAMPPAIARMIERHGLDEPVDPEELMREFDRDNTMRVCEGCDCDDNHACMDPMTGQPCFWLEEICLNGERVDVCSVCARAIAAMVKAGQMKVEGDADALVTYLEAELARHPAPLVELATEADVRRVIAMGAGGGA